MIISHSRKFIFVHNPKCAGTSFRTAIAAYEDDKTNFWGMFPSEFFLKRVDYAHLRLWELAALFPEVMQKFDEYRSIVFVKDPYTRFVSSVREHFKLFRQDKLDLLDADAQRARIEKFVEHEINIQRLMGDVAYVHFSPQSWFINLGTRKIVQHVIPMDANTDFIGTATTILELPRLPVERLNKSAISGEAILKSPKVIAFIEKFYNQDFELFQKHEHLRNLIKNPGSDANVAIFPARSA